MSQQFHGLWQYSALSFDRAVKQATLKLIEVILCSQLTPVITDLFLLVLTLWAWVVKPSQTVKTNS